MGTVNLEDVIDDARLITPAKTAEIEDNAITTAKIADADSLIPAFKAKKGCKATNLSAASATLSQNEGIASITRSSIGQYSLTFSVAEPDINYGVLLQPEGNTAAIATLGVLTVNGFTFQCRDNADAVFLDPPGFFIQIIRKN